MMNCLRCRSEKMKPDGGYEICERCGAQHWVGLPKKHTEKQPRELPTEEDMINCPRGT